MKRLFLTSILFTSILLSCSDESAIMPSENALEGFWKYEKVLFNGVDISGGDPERAISNYLHIKEDHSYGKCYINGEWAQQKNNLTLKGSFDNSTLVYEIVKISKKSLTLQIKLSPAEYGWTIPQFADHEIITITEQFVKVE